MTTGKLQDQHLMVQLRDANFDTFILLDKVCTCFPAALLLGLLPPWLSLDSGLLSCPCSAIRASNSSRVNSFSGAKIDRGSLQMSIWRDWSDQERTCRNVVLKSWRRMWAGPHIWWLASGLNHLSSPRDSSSLYAGGVSEKIKISTKLCNLMKTLFYTSDYH